jgi:hypothetical protein
MVLGYRPAENNQLAVALVGIEGQIMTAARANVQMATTDGGYSETEMQAMTLIEALKQVNGLDLAAVLLRGKYIQEIERTNAITNHPGGYHSLQEMARDQGISITELSQTMDLVRVVFPYIEETLRMPVYQLWEQIGRSNFKELVPVLKVIITGQPATTATVNASVERLLDDVTVTVRATPEGAEVFAAMDDETRPQEERDELRATVNRDLRRRTVAQLLDEGAQLTNRELRQRVRPERTPNIHATVLRNGGNTRLILAEVSQEQWDLLLRRMGAHMDEQALQLPADPRQRQLEVARVPEIRRLLALLEAA